MVFHSRLLENINDSDPSYLHFQNECFTMKCSITLERLSSSRLHKSSFHPSVFNFNGRWQIFHSLKVNFKTRIVVYIKGSSFFFHFASFFDSECQCDCFSLSCKGIVHQILKYHPFTTHHYVDDEIFKNPHNHVGVSLTERIPPDWMEFDGILLEACGSCGLKNLKSNGKAQHVSMLLIRYHPSVLKTWQCSLSCDVTSVFLAKISTAAS